MKYIVADLAVEISEIPGPKKQPAAICIYSPSEIRALLAAADAEIVPALSIAAFAGLRLAEIARLDWLRGQARRVIDCGGSRQGPDRCAPARAHH